MEKALATAGITLLMASVLSGCGVATIAPANDVAGKTGSSSQDCIAGFESKWNSTPVEGPVEGLPREVVTALTDSGRIIDAYSRDKDSAGTPEELGITYDVKMDAAWPKNSIVIIDTANDKVLDLFPLQPGDVICD